MNIPFERRQIPLWSDGEGNLVVNANVSDPNAPIPPGQNPILSSKFDLGGPVASLGRADAISIGVTGSTQIEIAPPNPDLVQEMQLAPLAGPDEQLFGVRIGGGGSILAEGSYPFTVLSAGGAVEAGANAMITYVRAFPRTVTLLAMLRDLMGGLRFPATLTAPPAPGEVVAFEYGGYLAFAVVGSVGYEIKGTKSVDLRDLHLAEYWRLGVVGSAELGVKVAGRFRIEARAGSSPDWVRLRVTRARKDDLRFAADVWAGVKTRAYGMPPTGQEFFGAMLGVTGKNWLTLIDGAVGAVGKVPPLDQLKQRIDKLGGDLIDRAAKAQINLERALQSYRGLHDSAIALYDRYGDPPLGQHLDAFAKLNSWEELRGDLDPAGWNVLAQLTDGDPGGASLGGMTEFKRRVADALALLRDAAHDDLRKLLQLTKTQFSLEHFFAAMDKTGSPSDLKSGAPELQHFLERLLGRVVDWLNNKDVQAAFDVLQKVSKSRDEFWKTFNDKMQEAAHARLVGQVHAEYGPSDEHIALIDVELRMSSDNGKKLFAQASRGEFTEVLSSWQPADVRLREGVFTHRLTKSALLHINIAGWHDWLGYQAMHQVVVEAEQRIQPEGNGLLNVLTTVDLKAGTDREHRTLRATERMQTNFLLRFMGESQGAIEDTGFNREDHQYAIDVITGQSASYQLKFTDSQTTRADLERLLGFARELGLDARGASFEALAPVLEQQGGNYGAVAAEYNVRFTAEGLERLFDKPVAANEIRGVLRRQVAANYARNPGLAQVGEWYGYDQVRAAWEEDPVGFRSIGLAVNGKTLDRPRRLVLDTLFSIERNIIRGFDELQKASKAKMPLLDFENRMGHFGDALDSFDTMDEGENSIFAVFDGLVRLRTNTPEARASSLALETTKAGEKRRTMFVLAGEAEKAVAAPLH